LCKTTRSKGYYQIDRALVERQLPTECFVLWLPDLYESEESRQSQAKWLLHLFKGQLWIGAELLLRGDDRWRLTQYERLAAAFDIPLCASGGVYMHSSERQRLQDCLTAIRVGRSVETLGYEGEPNSQRHLRSIDKLTKLYPQALLDATTKIAKKCDFSLDELAMSILKN
jgi:error-prone DNA polymerase